MNGVCTHLDRIHDVTPSSWGCEDCLAQGRRDWVHLRVCQECYVDQFAFELEGAPPAPSHP
jgi:hypothetical protein